MHKGRSVHKVSGTSRNKRRTDVVSPKVFRKDSQPIAERIKYIPTKLEDSALTETSTYSDKMAGQKCQFPICDAAGSMKLCLQQFQSVQQLRISIFNVKGLDVKKHRLFSKISLLGSKDQRRRHCSSKKTLTHSSTAVFNENLYLKLGKEDFSEFNLRIRLCEMSTRGCFRKSNIIGEVVFSLDGLNLNLDTTLEVELTKQEQSMKIVNWKHLNISRHDTIEEQVRKSMAQSTYY